METSEEKVEMREIPGHPGLYTFYGLRRNSQQERDEIFAYMDQAKARIEEETAERNERIKRLFPN